jgi:hypothetical protein
MQALNDTPVAASNVSGDVRHHCSNSDQRGHQRILN